MKICIVILLISISLLAQTQDSSDRSIEVDRILSEFNSKWDKAQISRREYKLNNYDAFDFNFDDEGYLKNIREAIDIEDNNIIIDHYRLIYVAFALYPPLDYDFNKAKEYFKAVEPSKSIWENVGQAFNSYRRLFSIDEMHLIENDFLNNSNVKEIKLSILANKLPTLKSTDPDEFNKIFSTIKNEYSEFPLARSIIQIFGTEPKVIVGADIPDFKFVSVDDISKIFTKNNLMGKHYIIDFWATWCKPCIEEMQYLKEANQKYSKDKLLIISVSIDSKIEVVNKFRKEKDEMNWENVFLSREIKSEVMSTFEVIGIPKPILVGREGKILAMNFDLRHNELEKTLAKFIK